MRDPINRLRLRRREPARAEDAPRTTPPPAGAPARDDLYDWLWPPNTVVDPAAWDRYWRDQLTHGMAGFVHMFVDDGDLVDAMRTRGLATVLCVGNGISQEPKALARAGFRVTALDLSPFATDVAERAEPPDEFLAGLVGGRAAGEGGGVTYVAGDLCDAALCPGPYDVVVDRKTLQLYPDAERPAALRAVARRLASPGIFYSHCHDGAWRPPKPRRHTLEPWFAAEGWPVWDGAAPLTGQVAWLYTTTG